MISTKGLLALIGHPTISQIVLTRHLGDVFAALIQLGHAPLKKPQTPEKDINDADEEFVMTQEKYDQLKTEQTYFAEKITKVVDKVYPPLTVKYLLVLQSCGASQAVKPLPKSINTTKIPTPKWVQARCGALLTHCLTSSTNGVINVIQGILDVGDTTNDDVQRYAIISTVVASPPSTGKYADLEEYFRLVSPQILAILDKEDSTDVKVYHMIACQCIRSLTERSLILSRRYLLGDLMEPLTRLCTAVQSDELVEVFVSEAEMDVCLKRLHMCFVVGNDPSMTFISHLQPVIMVLMQLHCRINLGVSHLRTTIEQLVQRFLRWSSRSMSVATMRSFALKENLADKDDRFQFHHMLDQYVFVAGDEGGIKAIGKEFKKAEEQSFYVDDDEKAIILTDLMQSNTDKNLGVEFFLSLLHDLTDLIQIENNEEELPIAKLDNLTTNKEEQLLQLERDLDLTMLNLRRRLMVVRLLGLMTEEDELQAELMKNSERLIAFLTLTFQRCASTCKVRKEKEKVAKNPEDEETYMGGGMAEKQSLQTALSLLCHIVTQPLVSMEKWQLMQKCLVDLDILAELYEDESIRKLAARLKNLIAINAKVIEHHQDMKSKANQIMDKTREARGKMDELKEFAAQAAKKDLELAKKESFKEALECLDDDEIPTRGHGLIRLTSLVVERDVETMDNFEKVFKVFNDNLADEDTYIYLQAIKGLTACSFQKADIVVDKLSSEFANLEDAKYPGEKGIELRIKVGESLVQVTRILGDFTPAHKNKLLNPFLAQVNHPDPLVRASSLSNIGEVCKNLRFSVGDVINEIFNILHQVVQFDKAIEVRRASVLVIKLLLEGLGDDTFRVLQGVLRDIWKTLIAQRNSESDEIMQVHIGQAIDEINEIVRRFLQPSNNMTKNIYVLDSPPDPF